MNQQSILEIAYTAFQFIWGIALFMFCLGTIITISDPYDIRPPVDFTIEKAGEVIADKKLFIVITSLKGIYFSHQYLKVSQYHIGSATC